MKIHLRFTLVLLFLPIAAIHAQDTKETDTTIVIRADRLTLDRQTGVQILSGNVLVTRGDVSIRGETLQLNMVDGVISRISGTGDPIRFRQVLSSGVEVITESLEIDYQTRSWVVVFKGNVQLRRGYWQLAGEIVEYNLRSRNFNAGGAYHGSDEGHRITITYEPGARE